MGSIYYNELTLVLWWSDESSHSRVQADNDVRAYLGFTQETV